MTATTTRRLLIPGLMTLVMLATLLTLGTWQVSRLLWKQGLLAAIAAGEQRPPVPLGESPPAFTRVRAEGRFAPVTALYGAEVRGNNGGARLLGILQREGAPPVLVDRGWVPVPLPPLPPAPTAVEGYIRPAETPGPFAPMRVHWLQGLSLCVVIACSLREPPSPYSHGFSAPCLFPRSSASS